MRATLTVLVAGVSLAGAALFCALVVAGCHFDASRSDPVREEEEAIRRAALPRLDRLSIRYRDATTDAERAAIEGEAQLIHEDVRDEVRALLRHHGRPVWTEPAPTR